MSDSVASAGRTAADDRQRSWWRPSWQATTDLLFPPRCASCGLDCPAVLGRPILCESCSAELTPSDRPVCQRCAMTCTPADKDAGNCYECRGRKILHEEARALGAYHGPLRAAVLRIKHYHHAPLARSLGQLLADRLRQLPFAQPPDFVAPVPMHWLKRLWRGANAPDTLAQSLAGALGLRSATDLLICRRILRRQSLLHADDRRRNVRQAYRVNWTYNIRGARVLVVDDVMTTGATVHEAARALRKAGAAAVYVATVARGSGDFWAGKAAPHQSS